MFCKYLSNQICKLSIFCVYGMWQNLPLTTAEIQQQRRNKIADFDAMVHLESNASERFVSSIIFISF